MRKITLKDIDGTILGRAVVVGIDMAGPSGDIEPMFTDFVVEGAGGCHDPIQKCQAFQIALEGDWPTHHFAIIANPRAQYLTYARRMREMGMTPNSPREYLEEL